MRPTLERASFTDPIFNAEFEVYFADLQNSILHYKNEYGVILDGIEDENPCAALFFVCPKRGTNVLFFSKRPSLTEVAHEALHATIAVLESRGVKIERGNDETAAYYHGFVITQIRSALSMIRKKLKKNAK